MADGGCAAAVLPGFSGKSAGNALFIALLMECFAGDVAIDPGTAYTTGLLSTVGRVVLDVTAQRDLRVSRVAPLSEDTLIERKLELFGITSCEAGAHVLRVWRFPADVFGAIRDQLLHGLAVDPLPNAKLLPVAVAAMDAAGYPLSGYRFYAEKYAIKAREDFGLSDE